MAFVRVAVLVLLVAAGICFALYALTGQAKYKKVGLYLLGGTLVAVLGFFLVLFVGRLRA
jgi:uncharacterized membrane protein